MCRLCCERHRTGFGGVDLVRRLAGLEAAITGLSIELAGLRADLTVAHDKAEVGSEYSAVPTGDHAPCPRPVPPTSHLPPSRSLLAALAALDDGDVPGAPLAPEGPTYEDHAPEGPAPEANASPAFGEPLLPDRSDRLTLIEGIDAAAASLLADLLVTRFADIAAFTPEDVAEVGRHLGDRRRIAREGWIEQAAILATGRDTAYVARRQGTGEPLADAALPALPAPAVGDDAPAPARTQPSNVVAFRRAAPGPAPRQPERQPVRQPGRQPGRKAAGSIAGALGGMAVAIAAASLTLAPAIEFRFAPIPALQSLPALQAWIDAPFGHLLVLPSRPRRDAGNACFTRPGLELAAGVSCLAGVGGL